MNSDTKDLNSMNFCSDACPALCLISCLKERDSVDLYSELGNEIISMLNWLKTRRSRKTQLPLEEDIKYGEEMLDKFNQTITACFSQLYTTSENEDFYWEFCSIKVYKGLLDERLANFLKELPSAIPQDFYTAEETHVKSQLNGKELCWVRDEFIAASHPVNPIDLVWLGDLDESLRNNIKYDIKRKLELLSNRLADENSGQEEQEVDRNPFPAVFNSPKSYQLFEYLLSNLGNSNADLSFIFRRMKEYDKEDPGIVCTVEEYKSFVKGQYRKKITKLKRLDEVNTNERKYKYASLLSSFKQVKK